MNTHEGVLFETFAKRESVFKSVLDYIWDKNIHAKTFRLDTSHKGYKGRKERTRNR